MINVKQEILLNSRVVFLNHTHVKSQLIYCLVLFMIIVSFFTLPFLYLTLSVKSLGIIKSNLERVEILSPTSGRLLTIDLYDNQKISKGSTLLTIDNSLPKRQNRVLNHQSVKLKMLLEDANSLIKNAGIRLGPKDFKLNTEFYRSNWQHYRVQFQMAVYTRQQVERTYYRYESLFQKNVVTKSEFEQHQFNYEQAISNQNLVTKMYKIQLQKDISQYETELSHLQNEQAQLNENQKQYHVKATVNGTIQKLTGFQEGAFVQIGQKIGEISPTGPLFAYCYVKPSDIGHIKKGQSVRFQIDAYNYNEWGILLGKVIDISDDTIVQNEQHYFMISCELDKNYLQLKNGYKGFIKKGMTLIARFTLSKRSLYQLLFNKVNDWIN